MLDVHSSAGSSHPLRRGTVMIFDTCQPHGVVRRGSHGFDLADFPRTTIGHSYSCPGSFPLESAPVEQALHVKFDIDPATAATLPCRASPAPLANESTSATTPASGGPELEAP